MARQGWRAIAAGLLVLAAGRAAAESRGLVVELRESEAPGAAVAGTVALYGASYALVIGNDRYTGGWPVLSKAVEDARAVAAALEASGFAVDLRTDLDGAGLRAALEEFFIVKGEDEEARLVVWFAGHGHTLDGEGFLVPTDAPPPAAGAKFKLAALPLRRFGEYVRLARAKHVFAAFDSCFAGTIFDTQRALYPAAITRATTLPVRQFLSAGDAGQTVSDDGTFRRLFLRALAGEEGADSNRDGYLTGSELGLYISARLTNLTEGRQTPRYGKLRDLDYDRGDIVFAVPREPPLEQAVRAEAAANRAALSERFESMDKAVREQFRRETEAPVEVAALPTAGRWRGEMVLEEARGPNCGRAYAQNMKLDFTVGDDAIAGEALGRGATRLRFVLKGRLDEAGRWSAQARELAYGTWYALALDGALPAGEGTWRDYANGCTGRFTLGRAE